MDNNQNNSNEKNLNLINKLRARLKTAKIVKKIASLTLACGMTLAAISCTSSNNSTSNITNSNGGTTSEQQSSNTENSKYSEVLQNLLSNEYYSWLLGKAKENNELYDSALFDPHPYAFLEDEGFDVEAIRNGEISCRTQSFVKENEPNNLYIATYVENKNGNYYTQYMLKYKLTDQEMQEYDALHSRVDGQFYIGAVFLNNEISKIKTPEVLCETKIDVDAHRIMHREFDQWASIYGGAICDVILNHFSVEDNEFNIYLFPRLDSKSNMKSNGKVSITYLAGDLQRVTSNNGVFCEPYTFGQFITVNEKNLKPADEAVFYHPQATNLTLYSTELITNIK